MDPRYFSYAAFGKKQGFQTFHKSGFAADQEEIAYRFEMFMQIDLMKIKPPEKTGMMAVSRLKFKSNRYFFFGLFYPGRDAFNRDGYYGGAIALCDHYIPKIQDLIETLEQLSVFARSHVLNEIHEPLLIPELQLMPYPKDFQPPSKTLPGIIDFRPTRLKFIEMAFRGQLGDESPIVYFIQDAKIFDDIEMRDFRLLEYEELMMEQEEALLKKQEILKLENFSLDTEVKRLLELQKKLSEEAKHLQNESNKLQQAEQRQRQMMAALSKEIDDRERTVQQLDKRETELCTRISSLVAQEMALRSDITAHKNTLKEVKIAMEAMNTEKKTLEKEIARLEKTCAEWKKKEQNLAQRFPELEHRKSKLTQTDISPKPHLKGTSTLMPADKNGFEH